MNQTVNQPAKTATQLLLIACLGATLAACGSTGSRLCDSDHPYRSARAGPQLQVPEGMERPRVDRTMAIPMPEGEQPPQHNDDAVKKVTECLLFPPPLPASAESAAGVSGSQPG